MALPYSYEYYSSQARVCHLNGTNHLNVVSYILLSLYFYMFLFHYNISDSYKSIKNRISNAIDAISDRDWLNIKQITPEFDVLYRRLLARLYRRNSRSTRLLANWRLDKAQEATLYRYSIDFLDEIGIATKYK